MFQHSANKNFLAASALLLCAGFAQAQTTPNSPLTATPASVSVSYQKPSTPGSNVAVAVTVASGSAAFVVDTTSVPSWLSLDVLSGTAVPSPGVTIHFVASAVAGTMVAGNYFATVNISVSGFADLAVPVSLTVNDPASTLTVSQGNTQTINWTYGTTKPTQTLTLLSSNQPIAFTVAATVSAPAAPAGWIHVSSASGIAYSFGTSITVSFLPDVLDNAAVGAALTGTVTITPSVGSPIAVAFTINVLEPPAAITSIFPTQTPVHASGTAIVVVTGAGFGNSGGYTAKPTVVSISYGATALTDVTTIGGSISIPNQNTLIITIPYQDNAGSPNAILSAAGPVGISITNGLSGETAVTSTLTVTTSPIIYAVTDGASLEQPVAGSVPNFAPYELITLFGDNFGPTAGTPVIGALDSFSRFPSSLTANTHSLTVTFYKQGTIGAGTKIADAYLLFATNNQINALVPSGVVPSSTLTDLQIVVTYNSVASTAFAAKPALTSPGVFTTAATGQGQGAILLSNFTVNSSASTATKAAKGSTVLIYVTGLGAPNSSAADTTTTAAVKFPGSCISPASYVTAEALTSPATADGALILSSKIASGHLPPCFATTGAVTVTIGGQPATVSYAGWVADSVTGLFQINAAVPTKAASGNAIPVVVTAGGVSSQAGVTMAIQ